MYLLERYATNNELITLTCFIEWHTNNNERITLTFKI